MAARTKTVEVRAYAAQVGSEWEVRLTNGWDANTQVRTFEGTSAKHQAGRLADDMNRVLATAGTKVPA